MILRPFSPFTVNPGGAPMTNRFGTSSDMVIQSFEENNILYCLAIDDKGLYLTDKNRLDSGFADINRYAVGRRNVHERLKALGLDPETLLTQNRHRVKLPGGETGKKINPLKASKRGLKS